MSDVPRKSARKCEICDIQDSFESRFFAKFPLDVNRCREWVQVTGKEDLVTVAIKTLNSSKFICGEHFKRKDIKKNKNRVRKHAVPCRNLKHKPLTEEQMSQFPFYVYKSQERPLLELFKGLLISDNKTTTNLDNVHIADILQKDFAIDIDALHELEVTTYVNVMKHILKNWPQWDELTQIVHDMKSSKNEEGLQKALLTKYWQLVEYLSAKLETVRPLAKKSLQIVELREAQTKIANEKKEESKEQSNDDDEFLDVVLEVHCTRSRLYNLFHRYPSNSNMFNLEESDSRVSLETLEYVDMFRWWNIGIYIEANPISIGWHTVHDYHHVLVNKKLPFNRNMEPKPNSLRFQEQCNQNQWVTKSALLGLFDAMEKAKKIDLSPTHLRLLLDVIKDDLVDLPLYIKKYCSYRRNWTKYPYVRYLYMESPETSSDVYDLQLEETINPRSAVSINHINMYKSLEEGMLVAIECSSCQYRFNSNTMLKELKQHIERYHANEPDWQCTNCKKYFTMIWLVKNKWQHACIEQLNI